MKTVRHVNIKNRQNYFFNSMTNIKHFDSNLLSIGRISCEKNTDCVFLRFNILKILTAKIPFILFLIM